MKDIAPELSALLADRYHLHNGALLRVLQERGQRQTLLVTFAGQKLVVKLAHPGRDENTVAAETEILAHLARHAFPAPAPFAALDGSLYVPFGGRFVTLYHYLEGAGPRPNDSFFTQLGRLLARLHSLPTEGYNRSSAYRPAAILAEVRPFLAGIRDPRDQAIADELLAIVDCFPSFEELPLGLIHTDPCYDNLLTTPSGLALIDWDDSGIAYPLLDIAYVVAYLCTFLPWDREALHVPGEGLVTWRPDWAQRFLQAYHAARPLSPLEKAHFMDAIRLNFLVYIRDWQTNRLIHENYQRMKQVETFTDPLLLP